MVTSGTRRCWRADLPTFDRVIIDRDVDPPTPVGLRGPVVLFMALAAAAGTSAIYPMQPAVADVARSLDSSVTAVGVALAAGPLGYLLGLVLLVPLVDRCRPDRVLAAQFGVLSLALAANAAVDGVLVLGCLVAVVGCCSAVGAGLSSVAARFAPPRRGGMVLGVVTAGISAGILAGRIVGGWLADEIGWRATLLVFAASCMVVAAACLTLVPADRGAGGHGYLSALRSLPALVVRHAALRLAALRGALWFFAFCAVWAGLAVALSEPPFSYSPERIGLYALAGLSGMLVTPLAGLLTDRVGARRVILAGLVLAGSAALVAAFGLASTAVTLACLALFDAGLFAAQVANQSRVLSIDPAAPARFNSAYMIVYFVGGSVGTAYGAAMADALGWTTTAVSAGAAVAAAAALTVVPLAGQPSSSAARRALAG